jgi:dihydrofolate synthase/folylpolyglutamate synthase
MDFRESLSYLLSLGHETLTIKLGLKNTETLLAALGNPQNDFPAVQIAGTNGKGSTAVMLESICLTAGIRTGLFTSPHLISITERIKIGGVEISEDEFARLTSAVKQTSEELVRSEPLQTLPTFFEQVTAIALLAFREAKVDLAILETGLGGRLDSTTAARANLVAITPVAMDHEEYLGNTIQQIAAEKAAIIRTGVTAVIAPQLPEVLEVIIKHCESAAADTRIVGFQRDELEGLPGRDRERFVRAMLNSVAGDGRCFVTFETPNGRYENVQLGLRGRHQIDNAIVAVALAEALREREFAISDEAIVRGLETASHAGRLELWQSPATILFDGAHNPVAARALRDYLEEFVPSPITMIFGAMKDKRLNEMAEALFPKANTLILTQMDNPRAAELEYLVESVPATFPKERVRTATTVTEALQLAMQLTPTGGLVCVTGSLYLVGAAQQLLEEDSRRIAHKGA